MKKFNDFFFPLEEDEQLSSHDAIWCYGGWLFFIALPIFMVIATW